LLTPFALTSDLKTVFAVHKEIGFVGIGDFVADGKL
jgi:hypothetical protein